MVDLNGKVALTRAPEWVGRVEGPVTGGVAHVVFDQGGSGNFRVTDLMEAEDKAWPPKGMETK